MFKLKKVELLGFKSFADRTRLEFSDGIAAVVGPNGCGKSNLSDCISWVLGEQSARMLRGERMADVIFNGTSTRPPTGMAEVSLTLVDPEFVEALPSEPEETAQALFPSDAGSSNGSEAPESANPDEQPANGDRPHPALRHRAGEITVTRRLFRSGESEYLINGELCRLRDIQDLFMGTGLGPESYAIIEQGRIGQILSSKPSDRRAILEEAAGVSKFKSRKRLAEAKLESSRANLARITDILEEVTKQVNSLKRQASKARRYRELHDEFRGRLRLVLGSRLRMLEAECERMGGEISKLQNECALAGHELGELENEHRSATLRAEDLENRLKQSRERLAQADLEHQRLGSNLEQLRQQIVGLESRIADASGESERLESQLAMLEKEAQDLKLRGEQLQREWEAARESAGRLSAEKDQFSARIASDDAEIESSRQALLAAISNAAELRNQLVQAEEMGLALDRQASRAEADQKSAEAEHHHLAAELETYDAECRSGESTLAGLARSFAEVTQALDLARAEESGRRTQLETLRQEFSGAAARKQALEESLARHSYTTESVRRLLSSDIPTNGHRFRPIGLLADFVEVTPGYEEVVEEFLKKDLECVVVAGHEEARSGIALLRSEGAGRSTFFVTHLPSNGHTNGHAHSEIRASEGVVAAVHELVRFEPRLGLNGDLALPALGNAFLVEDSTTAERLAGQYPDGHFLTTSGEHYHHRLVTGGRGASAGPLALRRDFRELERRTVEFEASIRDTEAALAECAGRVRQLETEKQNVEARKLEAEKKTLLTSEKHRQTLETLERAAERLRVIQNEAATLTAEREKLRASETILRSQLETAAAEQSALQSSIAGATQAVRDLRSQHEQKARELVEAETRASALGERNLAAQSELARLTAQAQDLHTRIERLAEQREAWRNEQSKMRMESEAIAARLAELEVEQQAARADLESLDEQSLAARARRDELVPLIDQARAALDSLREKRSEAEVSLARIESDRTHHAQQCRDELSAEPAQLLSELTPESALLGEALQAAEEELRALKSRIESLGPVNMMALEELQEAEERFAFLETQRQDLLASIDDTQQAIREIDQVSRQQFLEAFKAINAYFAETFRTLFGGGVGEMRLSDESDPDCGLDVVAQPPGKRLQNVLLLSGGEKALAALALLIAIFRYTPSPFCILDEVDAPLDESNVDRFTRLIQNMSRHTQFILITHNKRTMEISQLMYGVTMEEPGVSKLVSVKFEELEPELVAATA